MKSLLLFMFSLPVECCLCQNNDLPKIVNDTLYTSSGYKITSDQELKLGVGSNADGTFKYFISSGPPAPPGRKTKETPLSARYNNHTARVKKLKTEGNSKRGTFYLAVVGVGEMVNYKCDVENAIASGEILVPDQYKIKPKKTDSPSSISVADELMKLKQLYQDSVITKEEFEAQKKKLLNDNK